MYYEKIDWEDQNIVEAYDDFPLWSAPFGISLLNNIIMKKNITVLDI